MKKLRYRYFTLIFGFLLGISNGYIALWKDGYTKPLRVFPYRAEMLPAADQQALADGIHLDDDAALIRLLEDYLS